MKKLLYFLLFVPLALFGQENNLYNIPDTAFLNYLKQIHPELFVNDSLDIDAAYSLGNVIESPADYHMLWISDSSINDLDGLQYFSGISELYIHNNPELSNIPDISHFEHTYLSIRNNDILNCHNGLPENFTHQDVYPSLPICVNGCTDYLAINFTVGANNDDGSCHFKEEYDVPLRPISTFIVPEQIKSIQSAINIASKGDTILVSPGTYYENLIITKEVVLKSLNGHSQTTIKGDGKQSCVKIDLPEIRALYDSIYDYFLLNKGEYFYGPEGLGPVVHDSIAKISRYEVVIDGFTITGGGGSGRRNYPDDKIGGGIFVDENNSLTLKNSLVTKNKAIWGGGVWVDLGAEIQINSCEIKENYAKEVSAIYIWSSYQESTIMNSVVSNNKFEYEYPTHSNGPTKTVQIMGPVTIVHTTIVTRDYPSVIVPSYVSDDAHRVQIEIKNSFIPQSYIQEGGILFRVMQQHEFVDFENEDYRLSENSSAIGAGIYDETIPVTDIDGNTRHNLNGNMPDIGAYEHIVSQPQINTYPIDESFLSILNNGEFCGGCMHLIYNDSLNIDAAKHHESIGYWGWQEREHINLDGLQFFTSLKNLTINEFTGSGIIPELPKSLTNLRLDGNWTLPEFANSIKELSIRNNDSIRSIQLPDSLQVLSINNCDSLLTVDDLPESLLQTNISDNSNLTGCYDILSCNFSFQTHKDENCQYPEEQYDCHGNYFPEVGEYYQGGKVFYVGNDGLHGLIAAPEDIGEYSWGCFGFDVITEDWLHDGKVNTELILANCSERPIAASVCDEYSNDGYSDWFLADRHETKQMHTNLGRGSGNLGGFEYSSYWTSSEAYDSIYAVSASFSQTNSSSHYFFNNTNKNSARLVRPIRKFGGWNVGCTNELYCNYDSLATGDDGSCYGLLTQSCSRCDNYGAGENAIYLEGEFNDSNWDGICNDMEVLGCIDTLAKNFNYSANVNDGTCEYPEHGMNFNNQCYADSDNDGICDGNEIAGCKDELACNYDANLTTDTFNLVCYYPPENLNCNLLCLNDSDNDGVCDEYEIMGCTDASAINFSAEATDDDNSCIPLVTGCMDSLALNFNPLANTSDNYCIPVIYGCMDSLAFNYELPTGDNFTDVNTEDGSCIASVSGCLDSLAFNYNPIANTNDDSCTPVIHGCLDSLAFNYLAPTGDKLIDVNTGDDSCIPVVKGCLDSLFYNYAPQANTEDYSCMTQHEYIIDSIETVKQFVYEDANSIINSLYATIDSWNTVIDLNTGWNMFGYACPELVDLVLALSNHTEKIIILKDNNGQAYMPEFGFNGIGDLTPGHGYQIKVTEAIEGFSLCDWYVNDLPENIIPSLIEVLEGISLVGCTDNTACNYDKIHLYDDGSCEYESCIDECGVINGDNTTCLDCAGVPNGTAEDLGCGCGNPAAQEGYDCEGNEIIYQVGDFAHGGIVFYLDETGTYGLVASLEDIGSFEWGCMERHVSGADGQAIGTGYQNTMDVVNQGCIAGNGSVTAAQAALDAEINGYIDWYLPSIDELTQMYNTIGNGGSEGNIGGFETSDWPYYWSSTKDNFDNAWFIDFSNGSFGNEYRFDSYRVRVIRAF